MCPHSSFCNELQVRAVQCEVIESRCDSSEFRLLLVSQLAAPVVGASNFTMPRRPRGSRYTKVHHLTFQHDLHRVLSHHPHNLFQFSRTFHCKPLGLGCAGCSSTSRVVHWRSVCQIIFAIVRILFRTRNCSSVPARKMQVTVQKREAGRESKKHYVIFCEGPDREHHAQTCAQADFLSCQTRSPKEKPCWKL